MAAPALIELRSVRNAPQDVWVVVGGERMHRLTRVAAAELGVYEGDRWTAALARRVDAYARAEALRRAALRLLGQRDHSTTSLRERLSRLGATTRDIQALLADLTRAGWLDDARTLASRTAALRDRGWSKARIASALEAEGFGEAAVARFLGAAAVNDRDSIREAIRSSRKGTPAAIARRLAAAGFDSDEIWAAMEAAGMANEGIES